MTALPLSFWGWVRLDERTLHGLRVAGEAVPRTEAPERVLGPRADAWLDAPVALQMSELVLLTTRREIGARIDVARVGRRLRAFGRRGAPWIDLGDWRAAGSGRIDLPWSVQVDRRATRALVQRIGDELNPGTTVSEGAAERLVAAARAEALVVAVPLADAPPPPLPPLPSVATRGAFGEVVGTYVTRFARWGDERDRAHNVRLAAEALDGAVIAPGGELSFNDRVGPRTLDRGYRLAKVLVRGERVDGIGGGACQVASTLHAAAFFAGLDLVEHHPHSRPSAYIAMGLDATVTWGGLDLRLRNPWPFPILIRAAVDRNALRVDLLGRERLRTVDWRRRVVERTENATRHVHDPALGLDVQEVEDEGSAGFLVHRTRTVTEGARAWTETLTLRYPPADRIVRTGDAFPKM